MEKQHYVYIVRCADDTPAVRTIPYILDGPPTSNGVLPCTMPVRAQNTPGIVTLSI